MDFQASIDARTDMANQLPPTAPPRARRAPFQFSMRALLIVVTVVAIAAPLFSRGAIDLSGALVGTLIQFVAPVCLGTCALYCRGRRQTFFIGAFAASLVPIVRQRDMSFGSLGLSWAGPLIDAASALGGDAMCGYLALKTRDYIERRGWHRPDVDAP
jgi:hypothetical protein